MWPKYLCAPSSAFLISSFRSAHYEDIGLALPSSLLLPIIQSLAGKLPHPVAVATMPLKAASPSLFSFSSLHLSTLIPNTPIRASDFLVASLHTHRLQTSLHKRISFFDCFSTHLQSTSPFPNTLNTHPIWQTSQSSIQLISHYQ